MTLEEALKELNESRNYNVNTNLSVEINYREYDIENGYGKGHAEVTVDRPDDESYVFCDVDFEVEIDPNINFDSSAPSHNYYGELEDTGYLEIKSLKAECSDFKFNYYNIDGKVITEEEVKNTLSISDKELIDAENEIANIIKKEYLEEDLIDVLYDDHDAWPGVLDRDFWNA